MLSLNCGRCITANLVKSHPSQFNKNYFTVHNCFFFLLDNFVKMPSLDHLQIVTQHFHLKWTGLVTIYMVSTDAHMWYVYLLICSRLQIDEQKKDTYFFLLPEVDSDAIYRHHDVDFFLLDVFHLELVLPNRKDDQINTLSCCEGAAPISVGGFRSPECHIVKLEPCRQAVLTKSLDFYRKPHNTFAASKVSHLPILVAAVATLALASAHVSQTAATVLKWNKLWIKCLKKGISTRTSSEQLMRRSRSCRNIGEMFFFFNL